MNFDVPRDLAQRLADTRNRFASDVDTWLATADLKGNPYQVPVSFLWDGSAFVISTPHSSPTARNLRANGQARMAFGHTRDVVLVRGTATAMTAEDVEKALGDAFAEKTGFDPCRLKTPYQFFVIRPQHVQAWREANELQGRDLMREGEWLR
ncbi:MAG TPA: pyridoxamine 5'-phosphate oxidase family protein [Streptosporangiaceae bacterium]|jgi:nitroimidazol reductase NimA-like FMN-containing flavoprotein (pyridoxamine 5'-phosphate oxidase superfamily)|nr:pyridoxamine 5'-phosphate oxidase family protein [Streptosporangiaceae bacterium]